MYDECGNLAPKMKMIGSNIRFSTCVCVFQRGDTTHCVKLVSLNGKHYNGQSFHELTIHGHIQSCLNGYIYLSVKNLNQYLSSYLEPDGVIYQARLRREERRR